MLTLQIKLDAKSKYDLNLHHEDQDVEVCI